MTRPPPACVGDPAGMEHGPAVRCVAGHGVVADELRLPGVRVTAVRHAAGLAIDRHSHDTAKLAILVRGGATERMGLELVEHGRCALVARPRFAAHENQYHAHGAYSIIVELEQLPATQLDPEQARRHGRRIVEAFHGPGRAAAVGAAVHAALADLRAARGRAAPAWLERARELLFAELTEPPALADLARRVGVHPVHLAQTFRRRWQVSPHGYVRAHRVFRAVELIARGVPLGRVATETGFADQSHMTRAVRGARQASPGALRTLAP